MPRCSGGAPIKRKKHLQLNVSNKKKKEEHNNVYSIFRRRAREYTMLGIGCRAAFVRAHTHTARIRRKVFHKHRSYPLLHIFSPPSCLHISTPYAYRTFYKKARRDHFALPPSDVGTFEQTGVVFVGRPSRCLSSFFFSFLSFNRAVSFHY